jgi:hypothetical protein
MTQYNKPAPFPDPFVPVGERPFIGDSFGNLLKAVQQSGPQAPVTPGTGGGGTGLPTGFAGDMLYHNGTNWVRLANPGTHGSDPMWVLRHNATAPFWQKPIRCA